MTLATVLTRAQCGLDAPLVRVEVHCGGGLPQFSIVGLAETAVRESRDRVRAALAHGGFDFPAGRVTVNLAPADLPKEGGRYDLAIAVAILAASEQIPATGLDRTEYYGELSLSGELRAVRGMLAAALHAVRDGRRLVVPAQSAEEARVARGARVAGASTLLEVRNAQLGGAGLEFRTGGLLPAAQGHAPDLVDVRGQAAARRALEIAAAGAHSLLFIGPPGAGKSMLAQRLPGLLPQLGDEAALERAMLHSLVRPLPPLADWRLPPFRAPHHGASSAAVIGGGGRLRPGEISLAHQGVLFLDELPEFRRDVLEALREPLESGVVSIARAAWSGQFPARFQLVAAMNPCPCGFAGDPNGRCRCTPPVVRRYVSRISGPLVDRIDLHVEVPRLEYAALAPDAAASETSASVAARVRDARERQSARGAVNARLGARALAAACRLGPREHALLDAASRRLGLSARACHRVLRVARTIADLAGGEAVGLAELSEAIGYRRLDREPQAKAG